MIPKLKRVKFLKVLQITLNFCHYKIEYNPFVVKFQSILTTFEQNIEP